MNSSKKTEWKKESFLTPTAGHIHADKFLSKLCKSSFSEAIAWWSHANMSPTYLIENETENSGNKASKSIYNYGSREKETCDYGSLCIN